MTQAITFDTHAYVKKLKAVGFSEEQAETLATTQAELIDERLATKHDIEGLKHDIKELEITLKRDMKELETSLKRDIKESELRLTVKLGAMLTAGIIILAVLVKLL